MVGKRYRNNIESSGPSRTKRTGQRRRNRGESGIDYRQMMIALDPATAKRIGLTARPGTSTSRELFDQPPQQGSGGD